MHLRKKYLKKIIDSRIWLFGAGKRAREFYSKYKRSLNIEGCISNNDSEVEIRVDDGVLLKVDRPSEAVNNAIEKGTIIICVDDYAEIEEQLVSYGLEAGKNYFHYRIFDILMSDKKIAVLYGVCYMRPIFQQLNKSLGFTEEYESFYWLSYKAMTSSEYGLFICILKNCDLYIYNPSISRREKAIEDGHMHILPKKCIRIKVPSVGAEAYHPQAIVPRDAKRSYSIVPENSAYGPFTSQDWHINRMIEEGSSLLDIKRKLNNEKYFSVDEVKDNYERQLRKIEIQECNADIIISDYLKCNHRKKRIFLDGLHVSNEPICEMANRLLELIGCAAVDYMDEIDSMLIYATEVPIYPSVIKGLKLDIYLNQEPLYRLFTVWGYQWISFDEWIERYYNYTIHMKNYIAKGYFL